MYFAVSVRTGTELSVKKLLLNMIERTGFCLIDEVIAFDTFTLKVTKQGIKKRFKSAVKGYIFLKLYSDSMTIPAEVYHFVKSVPLVSKVFDFSIEEQEFNEFFTHVDTEETVEFTTNVVVTNEIAEVIESVINNESNEVPLVRMMDKLKLSIRRKKVFVSAHISILRELRITIEEATHNLLGKILSHANEREGVLL